MRVSKCEFCQKLEFQNVNLVKLLCSRYDFLDKSEFLIQRDNYETHNLRKDEHYLFMILCHDCFIFTDLFEWHTKNFEEKLFEAADVH